MPGSIVFPEFRNPLSNRCVIPKISLCDTFQPYVHFCEYLGIGDALHPFVERVATIVEMMNDCLRFCFHMFAAIA